MGFKLASTGGKGVLVAGDDYFDVHAASAGELPADPMLLLEQTKALTLLSSQLGSIEPTGQLDDVTLDAPIPRPRNSFAIGLNYRNHAVEAGLPIPPAPMVFTKYPSCITGPTANIEMRSDYVDFEGELVAVIGKTAKNVMIIHFFHFC